MKIDDFVGVVLIYVGGFIWGMIVVGFFVEKDIFENIFLEIYGVFKGGYVKIFGV